jgi:hypothetical protein
VCWKAWRRGVFIQLASDVDGRAREAASEECRESGLDWLACGHWLGIRCLSYVHADMHALTFPA